MRLIKIVSELKRSLIEDQIELTLLINAKFMDNLVLD